MDPMPAFMSRVKGWRLQGAALGLLVFIASKLS